MQHIITALSADEWTRRCKDIIHRQNGFENIIILADDSNDNLSFNQNIPNIFNQRIASIKHLLLSQMCQDHKERLSVSRYKYVFESEKKPCWC